MSYDDTGTENSILCTLALLTPTLTASPTDYGCYGNGSVSHHSGMLPAKLPRNKLSSFQISEYIKQRAVNSYNILPTQYHRHVINSSWSFNNLLISSKISHIRETWF